MTNDDSKPPAEIAELAYPGSANAGYSSPLAVKARTLKAHICRALADGELASASPVPCFNQLSAEDRARPYVGELPIFNPHVARYAGPHKDARSEAGPDLLASGELYSDFDSVRIERAAFHAWRATTDKVRLPDELFNDWPAPRPATKLKPKQLVDAVESRAKQKGISLAKARGEISAETGVSVGSLKTAASRQRAGKARARAAGKNAERRLRLVTK